MAGAAVALRAPVDGSRTSTNTKYPRSELREVAGSDLAAWDAAKGGHQLLVTLAFAHLPLGRPHVVGAQIHNGVDDVTALRLEGTNLWVTDGDNPHYALLTAGYVLGTRLNLRYIVRAGIVDVWLNGVSRAKVPVTSGTLFFKTGAYVQANCDNSTPCDATNYGEVRISSLKVVHRQ